MLVMCHVKATFWLFLFIDSAENYRFGCWFLCKTLFGIQ